MGLTDRKNTSAVGEEYEKRLLEKQQKLQEKTRSRLVLGIWGQPKTGKTGIALDFPERPIYVLDWDVGVESTWREHHGATDRIIIENPIELREDNVIDIAKSEKNSHNFLRFVRSRIEGGENPVFVLDGVDSWLTACLLKVNPDPTKVTKMMPWQYGERNKAFNHLLNMILLLKCDVIFITHELEKYEDNSPVGMQPVWGKELGGKLEQEIHSYRKRIKGEIHYIAELVGSRTRGNLVGTKFTTRQGAPPNIVWNGIPELREGKI